MRNKKLFWLLLASVFVNVSVAFAQLPEAAKAFGAYKTKFPASRLNLIFNQPAYAPGDTIFFSAWYLDEAQKLFPGRQVGSLDLIAADGHAVERIHFKIEAGRAVNQFVLPKNVEPGSYTLLAYTNWMRNFDNDWFFRKRIEIKGAQGISPAPQPMIAGAEGGSLIAGIPNHVVVFGDFPGAAISIRNQAGEELATASLDSTGVASINFTPVSGSQYTVTGPNNFKATLPAVKNDGVIVKLSGDALTLGSAGQYKDKAVMAVFTSQGKIVDARRVDLKAGSASLAIPNTMKGRFHQFYVLDETGSVLAERVFAVNTTNEFAGKISASGDVSQRQNVTMTIEAPAGADLSISAYQGKLFDRKDLKEAFALSELPDVLQWAEKYRKYETSLTEFLVTQHWSRINWTEILSNEQKKLSFPYHTILTKKGFVRSKITNQAVPDSTNVIVYLQKNTMGYDTYTHDGRFEVPFAFDFWGNDYLFVSVQRKSKDVPEYEVIFDNDAVGLPPIVPGKKLTTEDQYGTFSVNKQLIANSYSFFAQETKNTDTERRPNEIVEDELGGVSYEVNVEKYVVFPTMEDLLREVVPFVQYRKGGIAKGVRMMMRYPSGNKVSKSNPLFVVDGVMTRDPAYFMSLKPKDILTVKLANDPNKLQQLGKIGESGVVLIESKKGTLADSLRNASNVPVTGLNAAVAFHNQMQPAQSPSKRVPDLRSTLFWEPKAMSDPGGKLELTFATGDDVGPVTIVVQGMTSDGVPIFIEHQVDVKFRKNP